MLSSLAIQSCIPNATLAELANVRVTPAERDWLKKKCPYLNDTYLTFLETFQLRPSEQIDIKFTPTQDTGSDEDEGVVEYIIKGLWVDTILYEIPLLALTSQAYFMFSDKDWDHDNQEEKAFRKGCALLENGCVFSEFGSRRRRDYHTHDLIMKGLCRAAEEGKTKGWKGVLTGTSNVHFAMKYDVAAVGTVAHEWYMTIAAITEDYENANELALRYWLGCFGEGVCLSFWSIAAVDKEKWTNENSFRSLELPSPIHSAHRPSSTLSANPSVQLPWKAMLPRIPPSQMKLTPTILARPRHTPRFTPVFVRTRVTRPTLSRWCASSTTARASPRRRRSSFRTR